ncbi:MAG: hypothetical protein LAT67_02515 [Balneolales bacterium]|nr:hypothetical protein [Balneolales bacterium]
MEKKIPVLIVVIMLLLCIAVKSDALTASAFTDARFALNEDTRYSEFISYELTNTKETNYAELSEFNNKEFLKTTKESSNVTEDNDRGAFISLGSLVFIGILLLLPSSRTT